MPRRALLRREIRSRSSSSSSPIGFVARLQYVRVVTCSMHCISAAWKLSRAGIICLWRGDTAHAGVGEGLAYVFVFADQNAVDDVAGCDVGAEKLEFFCCPRQNRGSSGRRRGNRGASGRPRIWSRFVFWRRAVSYLAGVGRRA